MRYILAIAILAGASLMAHAQVPAHDSTPEIRPTKLTATIGDIVLRIDGDLLRWTPSGVDYKGTLMAVDGSVFSTVMSYPGSNHLGVAHYINIPNHPGKVEKEDIKSVRFKLDGKAVQNTGGEMNLTGKSFTMERISKIRTFDVDSRVTVKDGEFVQWVHVRTPTAVKLQVLWGMAVPWNTTMTEFSFGNDDGSVKDGKFNTATTKASEGLEKEVRWMAVYDPTSGKGGVTYVVTHPKNADAWFQYTDAPVAYRKQRLMSFADKTVPAGFDGTYCTATGFFTAAPEDWKAAAEVRALELKTSSATQEQQ